MTFSLHKTNWKTVSFGSVVDRGRVQWNQADTSIDRYVAGGHFDEAAIEVTRWGTPHDGGMGSTFTYVFEPGDVLYVSASWYLRKVGVATFRGVVADKTYVLRTTDPQVLDQRFLPWVLRSDALHTFAAAESTGSMNARMLWSTLSRFEFALPPVDEQRRLADLLWSAEAHRRAVAELVDAVAAAEERVYEVNARRIATVGDFVSAAKAGGTPSRKRPDFFGGDIPWLKSGEVVGDWITETDESITELGLAASSATWVEPGAVLVAMYGDGGTRGQVARAGTRLTTNQAVLALTPDQAKVDPDFFYYWLQTRQESLRNRSAGAAQKNLSKGLVLDEEFPDVPRDEQRRVVSTVSALRESVRRLRLEAESVRALGQSILQEVFG